MFPTTRVWGPRMIGRSIRRVVCTALVCGTVLTAGVARAHGPTVRVSYGRIVPEIVAIRVGSTIHFHNANRSGAPCTITAADGSFESPTLERAGDWHYTFETTGQFVYSVREYSGAQGRIVVTEE